jgi:hypothetical protein
MYMFFFLILVLYAFVSLLVVLFTFKLFACLILLLNWNQEFLNEQLNTFLLFNSYGNLQLRTSLSGVSKWAGTRYFYPPEIVYSTGRNYWTPQNYRWSKPQVRWSIGLWNIFHKKLMITSIAEFSHSNRTTASWPSWWNIPCFKNNFT